MSKMRIYSARCSSPHATPHQSWLLLSIGRNFCSMLIRSLRATLVSLRDTCQPKWLSLPLCWGKRLCSVGSSLPFWFPSLLAWLQAWQPQVGMQGLRVLRDWPSSYRSFLVWFITGFSNTWDFVDYINERSKINDQAPYYSSRRIHVYYNYFLQIMSEYTRFCHFMSSSHYGFYAYDS